MIHLVDSEIVEMALSGLIQNNAMEASSLPLDMIAWDDLVAYANEIITSLNDLRHSLGVNQVTTHVKILSSIYMYIFRSMTFLIHLLILLLNYFLG